MIGRTLGHYRILERIGAGGMGEVYRARDERLERDVALKVLPADVLAEETARKRFRREALTLSKLKHSHIAHVYDYDTQDGVDFLVMEYVEGTPLKEELSKGSLPEKQISRLGAQVAGALEEAHEQGIVHRDLKPGNIVLTPKGQAKVLDFGLAKLVEPEVKVEAGETVDNLTASKVISGTLPYMSPEQLLGATVDARSDIYSFGVVLYEMATGQRPFQEKGATGVAASILQQVPPPPGAVNPRVSAGLESVILKCLEKEPEQRYQSAQELRIDLERLHRDPQSGRPAAARAERSSTAGATQAEELWVAVLPFKAPRADADLEALADGLTEDVTTGLSRFPYLRVIARNSTLRFKGQAVDVRTVGKDLGARYVLEGGVRKSGATVRVSAQVVDAGTGAHLWAETYDRDLAVMSVFDLQDNVAAKVVSTIADAYGVLPRSMGALVKARPAESITPYEAVLRQFAYYHLLTPEEHRDVRDCLERAVEQAPDYADAWASLALMVLEEHKHSFNARPDPLSRALAAARRAVELDAANQLAYFALATAYFFRKDFDGFRLAAERALALNPWDGNTKAWMGLLIAYSGDWERGLALAAAAMTLNPHHPGWYHFGSFWNHYRKGEYQQALESVRKINMPSYFYWHAALAAAYGQLGRTEEARRAADELLGLYPDYPVKAREEFGKWLGPDLVEHWLQGLRRAGLEIRPGEGRTPAVPPEATSDSGAARAAATDSGAVRVQSQAMSIAVLPFHNLSADPEQEYFADGITEEIINTLTTVPGLRVIARTSAFAFKGQNTDIRKIADVLGVGSVLEGGVRRAGNRIRVTAQLIAAADGSHIWSERYDRQMEDLFAIQDEIASAIASEMKLKFAPDPAVRPRRETNLRAYEAYLRYRQHQWGFTPESLRRSRECLEQAMALDPGFALPYAGLADHYLASTVAGLRPAEAMPKARELAQRALELDPDLPEAHGMLGIVAGPYEWDWKEAERRFLLATAREPVPWHVRQWHSFFYLFPVGRSEEALRQSLRVLEDDPLSQVNSMVGGLIYEGLGREEEANAAYGKVLELDPHFWWGWLQFGLHLAVHGRQAEARECAERAFAIYPAAPATLGLRAGLLKTVGETARAEELLAQAPAGPYGTALARTCFHLVCGEIEPSVEWLAKAVEEHQPNLISSLIRPFERLFRQSPAWPALLQKMNLKPGLKDSQA